ncbi:MAG: chorismate synthase [Clostridia bacterium]|nr:chorismate synthase [Clostridia bacterium]
MANIYGNNIKLAIFGGSHDVEIGMTLEGFPAGVRLPKAELLAFMARRAPGQGPWATTRKEPDIPVFTAGVTEETDAEGSKIYVTDGTSMRAVIINQNQRSGDYTSLLDVPRPSHADYAARMKFGDSVDLRGGGKYSGRLTAPLCIAGAFCLAYLRERGIEVGAHILQVGAVKDTAFDRLHLTSEALHAPAKSSFSVIDPEAGEAMKGEIECARMTADSVGGSVECAVIGLPVGLGDHPFEGMEGRLSAILFSIPAVKAVAFGDGFDFVQGYGSTHNDAYCVEDGKIITKTNHCGGIVGGMSTGMPVIFSCAFKPTPSIGSEQESVSLSRRENTPLTIKGRHDPCIIPRAVPVVEAAAAVAVVDMMLDL